MQKNISFGEANLEVPSARKPRENIFKQNMTFSTTLQNRFNIFNQDEEDFPTLPMVPSRTSHGRVNIPELVNTICNN